MGWGGWPDKIKVQATPNISHDNTVSDNLIYNYMLSLDDGGGIYTQGITGSSIADGEKVTGNYIHDQWGIGKQRYTATASTTKPLPATCSTTPRTSTWAPRTSTTATGSATTIPR